MTEDQDQTDITGPEENTVLSPGHYKTDSSEPQKRDRRSISRMEVIDVIEKFALNFSRGNAIKYILRAGKKDPSQEVTDLKKARQYLNREIKRLEGKHGW